MVVLFFTLVASALAGYANPPNIAPAFAAYGSGYPTPFNSYGVAPGYTSAPVIPPYSIAPMYAGPSAYQTGYPQASLGMYTPPPPPPPPFPAYKNSYMTGYMSGYNAAPYGAGPMGAYGTGPIGPTGGPILPSGGPIVPGGPILPTGGPILPSGGPLTSPGLVNTLTGNVSPVNPAGVLPAFNNDPWASISQPILRGAPTKQLNTTVTSDEIEESKKKAKI